MKFKKPLVAAAALVALAIAVVPLFTSRPSPKLRGFGAVPGGGFVPPTKIGGAGTVGGTGTANTIAKWTAASTQGDSSITDDGSVVSTSLRANFLANTPSAVFGSAGRGWYVTNNEFNQGHNFASTDTGFINYSGHSGGTSQFRNTWFGNGKNAAAPILYLEAANARVGINTASPTVALDVVGAAKVSGAATLAGGATSTAGDLNWGPLGGNGGLFINPTTGQAYFNSLTSSSTHKWGFGFGAETTPEAPIDITALTYDPGTSNPRTDSKETLMRGIATAQYNTTGGHIHVSDIFLDSAHTKASGSNRLNDVLLRLDANGPLGGAADHATALWIDKGEFRNSGHTTYAVRPSTGGGPTAPPAISSCGSGPSGSSSGNDNGGRITVGGGGPSSCTLTFQSTWVDYTATGAAPACLVANKGGVATGLSWTESSTALVISWTGGSPATFTYHCFGLDDSVPGP